MFGERLWPFELQRKIYDYKVLSKFSGAIGGVVGVVGVAGAARAPIKA